MNLQVFVCSSIGCTCGLGPRLEREEFGQHSKKDTRGCVINLEVKLLKRKDEEAETKTREKTKENAVGQAAPDMSSVATGRVRSLSLSPRYRTCPVTYRTCPVTL